MYIYIYIYIVHTVYIHSVQYILLPMILVRNQIRGMLGQELGKITLGRTKYKFRISSIKNSSLNPEDGSDRLSLNFGKKVSLLAR